MSQAEEEDDVGFEIADADIQQARSIVGQYLPSRTPELTTAATFDSIKNFARSYGDDNPLYCDEWYGAGTTWNGQIAPPLIGVALNRVLRSDPRPPNLKVPSFRGVHNFVSGTAWEFYRPVRPGDRLYTFQGYESVEEKESSFAGRSVIITRRHIRMNAEAELVSIARVILIHAERKAARTRGKYSTIDAANYSESDIQRIDSIYATEVRRGAEVRYFEEVGIGEKLGPVAKGPLTVTDMIVFHTGGYGSSPFEPSTSRLAYQNRKRIPAFYINNDQGIPDVAQRVHWDSGWARQVGAPMAYDYGVLRDCWLSHLVTDWMGDKAWLWKQSSQMRSFNYLGDFHLMTGEVVGKRIESGMFVVDLEIRGTNQRGEVTCPATASVVLPSHGSATVALPVAPPDVVADARRFMQRHYELGGD